MAVIPPGARDPATLHQTPPMSGRRIDLVEAPRIRKEPTHLTPQFDAPLLNARAARTIPI
jgi:hypothetical protein